MKTKKYRPTKNGGSTKKGGLFFSIEGIHRKMCMIMGKYNAILTRLGVGQNQCSYKDKNDKIYYPVRIILTVFDKDDNYIIGKNKNIERLSTIIKKNPSKITLFTDNQLRLVFTKENLQILGDDKEKIIRMITKEQWEQSDFENYMSDLGIYKPNISQDENINDLAVENQNQSDSMIEITKQSVFSKFNSFVKSTVKNTVKKIDLFRLPRVYNELTKIINRYNVKLQKPSPYTYNKVEIMMEAQSNKKPKEMDALFDENPKEMDAPSDENPKEMDAPSDENPKKYSFCTGLKANSLFSKV
jgi:hypothetical protein